MRLLTWIMDFTLWVLEKFGFINSMILLIWFCFFLSLVLVMISNKRFFEVCTIGRGQVYSYERDTSEEGWYMSVKLLDVKGQPCYEARFRGPKEGTILEVAYKKRRDYGYEIRPNDKHWREGLFWILQGIPLVIMLGLFIYSHFINPGVYIP